MIKIIQIYMGSHPDVKKNGIIINPISCIIKPKLNGENELEIEAPIDKDGLYKYIQDNNYTSVPTPDFDEPQLYKIYNTKKSMSGDSITAYARHVQFNLAKNIIFNKSLGICNGQQALDRILENTAFTGYSDITIQSTGQYKLRSVMNAINGSEDNSFVNVWGGEISCNNYYLAINTKRGSDKGVRVTFGYNLEDIEEDLNYDDVITRLYPYSGDLVLSSTTPYVDSPLIMNIGILEDKIEFSDIKVKERTYDEDGTETTAADAEGFNTRAEAEAEMIRRCNKLYFKGLDKITANYVVKMHDLSKTTSYKRLGYDVLEKICLGDTVHCYNKNIDIEVEARCISYEWDCINEEYIQIELGQFTSNYVNMQNNRLDNLYKTIQETEQKILLQVDSLDNQFTGKIEVEAKKINAVVQKNATGMGWTLNQQEFVVACLGASGKNVAINQYGLTINNGKLFLKNSSGDIVFEVDLDGICNALGGFIVKDDDVTTKINADGIRITNTNGYTGLISVDDKTRLLIPDDLMVGKKLNVGGLCTVGGNFSVSKNTHIEGDLTVVGDLTVNGDTLEDIIDARIHALK